ncbi:hypothetical protein ABZ642_27875 [Streptomyces sp. NPDC007157]|uniref:hypothetical protein n=1 Tax=Streptomyces sp. NPDC007157 TaxID=3154681 RepID=UPI0033F52F20
MGGETEAHSAIAGESSTSARDVEPAQPDRRVFSWRNVAGKVAGAAVLLAVAADRLGLHFFLLCARIAVRAYSWFGQGH